MKTIEQRQAEIMAKAESDVARARKECEIISALPIPPSFVHVYPLYGRCATAKYNVVNAGEAAAVFEAFKDKAPGYATKTGTTKSIKAAWDEKADEVTPALFFIEIQKHDQSIFFFIDTVHGKVKIEISCGFSPFGSFYVADANRRVYYRWEFRPENRLLGLLRVANYARTATHGEMSAPHMIFAGFDSFELYDSLGIERPESEG